MGTHFLSLRFAQSGQREGLRHEAAFSFAEVLCGKFLLLACPNCMDTHERETSTLYKPSACPECGALLMLRKRPVPHLVLVCRNCHEIFEGVIGQSAPRMQPVCPRCGVARGPGSWHRPESAVATPYAVGRSDVGPELRHTI